MTNPANPSSPTPPTPPAPPATPPAPAKRYFFKELYSNSWFIGGKAVEFEQIDQNRGVLALDATDPLVSGLDQAAHDQVGGIVKISQEEYEKKRLLHPFKQKDPDRLQVAPRADQPRGKAFRPPPPQQSPESPAQLADQNAPPAAPAAGSEVPQGPPDQPDFRTGGKKFTPATARAGTGKAAEPSPV